MVPEALRTKYIVRPPLDEWVNQSGNIILIGEAAHPLMVCVFDSLPFRFVLFTCRNLFQPFTMHNASLTVEDAAVLGSLMSHLSSPDQLPQMLQAYQDLRLQRVKQVQDSELNNAALVTQADPQIRAMRDAALGQSLKQQSSSLDKWSDEQLRTQWEEIGAVFGYDAADAAEDWWIKWGALGELSRKEASRPLFNFSFHVTQTVDEVA
jgi:salicylate hydroxylase